MKEQEVKEHWTAAKFIRSNGSVLDFSGLYDVSDLGRVRSLNYHRTGKTKVMRQATYGAKDGSIYYMVYLHKDNKRHALSVHRLVLSSFKMHDFFPNAVVDHIDVRTETICDNRLSNLRWVTIQQNNSTEHLREIKSKKFTNRKDQSRRVRVTFPDGTQKVFPSAMEVTRHLDLPHITVSQYIHKCKGHYKKMGLHFEYID